MDPAIAVEWALAALWMTFVLCGPALLAILVVGLVIGVLQAATSINEQTLSFVPKLAISMGVLALASGFMLTVMVDYFQTIFETIRAIR